MRRITLITAVALVFGMMTASAELRRDPDSPRRETETVDSADPIGPEAADCS